MSPEAQQPSPEGAAKRLRAWRVAVVLAIGLVGGLAPACSLLIDFDAYRGTGSAAAESGPPSDGGSDGDADDDGGSCEASDRLTDPANCGACGHVCIEGAGSCDAGHCPLTPVFDEDGGTVQALVVPSRPDGGTYLYFTTGDPFVARRSLASGAIEKSLTNGSGARALAVNSSGSVGAVAIGNKTIGVFDDVSFPTQPVTPISTDHFGLGPVWISNAEVYWGDSQGAWRSAATPGADAGGGPDAGTATPVGFAEASGNVVWVTATGDVYSTPANVPGHVTRLVAGTGTETFGCITLTRTYLYLCEKTPIGGGLIIYAVDNLATPLRTLALTDPQAVVTDGPYVYFVDFRSKASNDSRLYRARADGTGSFILADGFRSSRGLAVDDQYVYFGDGPRILRTSK